MVKYNITEEDELQRVAHLSRYTQNVIGSEEFSRLYHIVRKEIDGIPVSDAIFRHFSKIGARQLVPAPLECQAAHQIQIQDAEDYKMSLSLLRVVPEDEVSLKFAMVQCGMKVAPIQTTDPHLIVNVWADSTLVFEGAPNINTGISSSLAQNSRGAAQNTFLPPLVAANEALQLLESQGAVLENDSPDEQERMVRLWGFQGNMAIEPDCDNTYFDAVRTLLSAKPNDVFAYTLVHFKEEYEEMGGSRISIVCEIDDQVCQGQEQRFVPEQNLFTELLDRPRSQAFEYLAEQCAPPSRGNWFFVKFKGEASPNMWKPTDEQLRTDVAVITKPTFSGGECVIKGYLGFPKYEDDLESESQSWNAEEFQPYVQTALDLLTWEETGKRVRPRHVTYVISEPGEPQPLADEIVQVDLFACLRRSDLVHLHPASRPANVGISERRFDFVKSDRNDGAVRLFLPNFYPAGQLHDLWVVPAEMSDAQQVIYPTAVRHIRDMLEQSLGDTSFIEMVQLWDPMTVYGWTGEKNDCAHCEIPLRGDIDPEVVSAMDGMLAEIAAIAARDGLASPVVLIHPVWRTGANPQAADPSGVTRIQLPEIPYGGHIWDLLDRYRAPGTDGYHCVIKQHPHVASPFNEFATFTIGPDISRLDWFKIRTKITSQFVDVSFIPPRRAHFLDRIPTSNVWGPRYGLVAESTRALISEGKDPRNQCPWCLERYMPYTTATDDERKAHIAEDHVYEILDLLPDNSGSGSSSDSEDDEDDDGGSDHGGAVSGLPQDVSMEDAVNPEPFPRFRAPSERQPSQRASASEENNGASEAAVNSRARTRDKGKGKAIAASDDSNSGQGDSNAVATSQRRTGNKRKRQAVDYSDGSDYNDGNGRDAAEQFAGASQAEASSSAQGRARATKKRARPAQARETEVLPSIPLPEPVEGTKQRRRREAEKNWVEELGPSDPDFVPGDGYRCSRCLRKVPSVVPPVNKGQQSGSNMPREEEIAMHYDPNRSCGIRQGLGSTENLPNRSGWITLKSDKEAKLARETFRERFPAYRNTIYPVVETDKRQSFWRSDPNHPRNEASWGLIWPPISGYPPFEADPPQETPPPTPPRRRRGRKPKVPRPEDDNGDGSDSAGAGPSTGRGNPRKRQRLDAPSSSSQAVQRSGHDHGHGQGEGEGGEDATAAAAASVQSSSASKRRRIQADTTFRPSAGASEDDDDDEE